MSVLLRSLLAVTTGATLLAATAAPAVAQPPEGTIRSAGGAAAVTGSYLVVYKDSVVARQRVGDISRGLAARHQGAVARSYEAVLRGFEFRGSERMARRVAADPAVAYVEQNQRVRVAGEQINPTWGLDRINQRNRPLDVRYTYPRQAGTVHAYVLDTGIRFSHAEFGGRAVSGYDFVDNDADASDCDGHGTHVAGTIGGTTYGVAKGVTLVGVRVLNCEGSGTWAGVVAGIDWVTAHAVRPAVANMSLGGGPSQIVDDAVRNSIRSGITFGLAAGNGDEFGNRLNACGSSPARVTEAVTVGATDVYDYAATFSNYGSCVDLLAPGVDVTSAWVTGDQATARLDGTSMATPHVVGAAAILLAGHPDWTPQQIRDQLLADSTTGLVMNPGSGTPNNLLYVAPLPPRDGFSPQPGTPIRPRPGTSTTSGVAPRR
ncbi:S8 family peptidase [Plantactinospora sp. GCM10030261]|uniref:S8 family peptidase n=1 Tax=Plantactinospora sp. GCM10030261 TaxID=3273420 RepID=UPI00361DC340